MKIFCKGLIRDNRAVVIYLNRKIVKDFPVYFTADVSFENIKEREKSR